MALVFCAECGKEISDKSENCIHCGFPIAREKERIIQAKEQAWIKRNQSALQLPDAEAIPLLVKLGDEGYLLGYINAGIRYSNCGDVQSAHACYMKAYMIDHKSCDGLSAQHLGYLYARKTTSYFNTEKAIHCLKESNSPMANRRLGQIYDPHYKDDGFDAYKDYKLALEYYRKLLVGKHLSYIASVYNDIGIIYGDFFKHYILASCYCLLAKQISNDQTHSNNYNIYISLVRNKNGSIWEKNIQSIHSYEDIDPMIERVNAEIKASASTNTKTRSGGPRCPTCGSDNIEKVGILDRAISAYVLSFLSNKIGKQFKCRNCGYLW